jgi:protein phosphatase
MIKLKVEGNVPLARFGHTITMVLKQKLLLFGGATGDTGKYSITDNTYLFDIASNYWKKLDTTGTVPSPRAAHAACAIEASQVVVYGGASGGGCFASDDLMLLDLKDSIGVWNTIKVIGETPKKRYGHTMVFCKPFIIIFGGNISTVTVNDCWALNVEKTPIAWQKVEPAGPGPHPRVYHAAICSRAMGGRSMVVFGGRAAEPESTALADCWTLARQDDAWAWARLKARKESLSIGRFQHSIQMVDSLMLVIGGRSGAVSDRLPFDVFDFETMEWHSFNCLQRFRHGSAIEERALYLYGGF